MRDFQQRLFLINIFTDTIYHVMEACDDVLCVVQLMALSERCQSIEEELAVINNKLSCASDLIADLLQ